jgi:hypothetical protein
MRATLARILLRGSVLDAYASYASNWLAGAMPAFADLLLTNASDERRHARMQAEMAETLGGPKGGDPYARAMWGGWSEPLEHQVIWRLTMLNLVEWRAMIAFHVLGRRCRALGLRDVGHAFHEIARDEQRHLRVGWDALRSRGGVPIELMDAVTARLAALDHEDRFLEVEAPAQLGIGPMSAVGIAVAARFKERSELCRMS